MPLSAHGVRVLLYLVADPASYLFGTRNADTPLALIAATATITSDMEWKPTVPRSIVDELWNAGYLRDDTEDHQSVNVAFFASDKAKDELGPTALPLQALHNGVDIRLRLVPLQSGAEWTGICFLKWPDGRTENITPFPDTELSVRWNLPGIRP